MRVTFGLLLLLAACQTAPAETAAPAEPPRPQTGSVPVSPDAEEIAARQCGSPVRPETVHHESNVITFRCLREEP